jgi:hypothetical protein
MFVAEAARIREILADAGPVSPLLNLGSSTGVYRRERKPHIERLLFAPLRETGVAVDHCDLKPGEGVDISGDFMDASLRAELRGRRYRCLLVANMLEHVRDRDAVAAACEEIVGPGGLVLATVPSSYPYHADPIDSLYRPSPAALAALFRGSEPVISESVAGPSYAERIAEEGSTPLRAFGSTLLAALLAPARPRTFLARLHRWFWYRRPYTVSLALVRVRGSTSAGEAAAPSPS